MQTRESSHSPLMRSNSVSSHSPSVVIGKRELIAWIERHTNVRKLSKYNSGIPDLSDGTLLLTLFSLTFPRHKIRPASTQTHSPSQAASINWGNLYKKLQIVAIPKSLIDRQKVSGPTFFHDRRQSHHDEEEAARREFAVFSSVAIFYFLFHVARQRDFTAEFSIDLSDDLTEYLQSVDSIKSLVLGKAMAIEIPEPLSSQIMAMIDGPEPSTVNSSAASSSDENDNRNMNISRSSSRSNSEDNRGRSEDSQREENNPPPNSHSNTRRSASQSIIMDGGTQKNRFEKDIKSRDHKDRHQLDSRNVDDKSEYLPNSEYKEMSTQRSYNEENEKLVDQLREAAQIIEHLQDRHAVEITKREEKIHELHTNGVKNLERISQLREDLQKSQEIGGNMERMLGMVTREKDELLKELHQYKKQEHRDSLGSTYQGTSTSCEEALQNLNNKLQEELQKEKKRNTFLRTLSIGRDSTFIPSETENCGNSTLNTPHSILQGVSPVARTPSQQRGLLNGIIDSQHLQDALPTTVIKAHIPIKTSNRSKTVVRELDGCDMVEEVYDMFRQRGSSSSSDGRHVHNSSEEDDVIKNKLWVLLSAYQVLESRVNSARTTIEKLLCDRKDLLELVQEQQEELDSLDIRMKRETNEKENFESMLFKAEEELITIREEKSQLIIEKEQGGTLSDKRKEEVLKVYASFDQYDKHVSNYKKRDVLWRDLCSILRQMALLAGRPKTIDERDELEYQASVVVEKLKSISVTLDNENANQSSPLYATVVELKTKTHECEVQIAELQQRLSDASNHIEKMNRQADFDRSRITSADSLLKEVEDSSKRICKALRDKVQSLLDSNCTLELCLQSREQALGEINNIWDATSVNKIDMKHKSMHASPETAKDREHHVNNCEGSQLKYEQSSTESQKDITQYRSSNNQTNYNYSMERDLGKQNIVSVPPFRLTSPSPPSIYDQDYNIDKSSRVNDHSGHHRGDDRGGSSNIGAVDFHFESTTRNNMHKQTSQKPEPGLVLPSSVSQYAYWRGDQSSGDVIKNNREKTDERKDFILNGFGKSLSPAKSPSARQPITT